MVQQYRVQWSIPNAGPSVSTFHAQASAPGTAQAFVDNVRAFFAAIVTVIPNDVTLSFESEVATLDTATGTLTGVTPVTPPAAVVGTGTGAWAGGTGARIVWVTGAIVSGRRVRGSTFIVPADADSFSNDGRLSAGAITLLNNQGNALIAAGISDSAEMQVYSRPVPGRPGAVHSIVTTQTSGVAGTLRGRKY